MSQENLENKLHVLSLNKVKGVNIFPPFNDVKEREKYLSDLQKELGKRVVSALGDRKGYYVAWSYDLSKLHDFSERNNLNGKEYQIMTICGADSGPFA